MLLFKKLKNGRTKRVKRERFFEAMPFSLSRSAIVRRGCRQRDRQQRQACCPPCCRTADDATPRPRRYSAAAAGNTGRSFGRRLAQCLPEVCPQCSQAGGRAGRLSTPLPSPDPHTARLPGHFQWSTWLPLRNVILKMLSCRQT